jgi:hypothetical protein
MDSVNINTTKEAVTMAIHVRLIDDSGKRDEINAVPP